jgi:hypothetical protein
MPMLPPHGAVTLVHRDTLLSLGGYLVNYNRQDGYMLWALFKKSDRTVQVLDDSIFYYRQHVKSLSFNRSKILSTRYSILEDLVPQNSLRYNVFLYGLVGDRMDELIKGNSKIIDCSENAYLYFPEKIDYPGLTYIQRELNVLVSYTEILDKLKLQMNEFNVFINPNYTAGPRAIMHTLMTAKLTGELKKFVLARRIKSEIYLAQNEVQSISFGANLFNENPIFAKFSGMEVIPRDASSNSPIFIVEYNDQII